MQSHRFEMTLADDGVLNLRDRPFRRGESVEIIIQSRKNEAKSDARYPLRGLPITFHSPMESVVEDEWEALQ